MINLADSIHKHCPTLDPALIEMHCRRMPEAYFERYSPAEIARHLRLLASLTSERLVAVEVHSLAAHAFDIVLAGVDLSGALACITTALATDGLSLQDVQLAVYLEAEPAEGAPSEPTYFVNVLRVSGQLRGRSPSEVAEGLQERLAGAFRQLAAGDLEEAESVASDSWGSGAHTSGSKPSGSSRPQTPAPASGEGLTDTVLGGDFRLMGKLAQGGMAQVYLATQISLNRTVVVKLAYHDTSTDQTAVARFAREATVLGSFSCPYIVQVLATGSVPAQDHRTMQWLAMEYMSGGDLAYWVRQHGRPPIELGVRWFRQTLEGLHYAHRHEILHRDLKPHNLLLTSDGDVKISDFGLVKPARESSDFHTSPGAILGTPHYMSPEQALGDPLDERSDLFSLGATFLHVFTGRLPYEQKSYTAVLVEIAQREAPRLSALMSDAPAPLEIILGRLMARRREERYQEVHVVLEELASYERRGLLPCADSGASALTVPTTPVADSPPPTIDWKPPGE